MSWHDTQFDTGDEERILQKVHDIEWAILMICIAVVVSYFL
jgi:hypothetical protein